MPRDCDDTRLYFCPKCGHRWERPAYPGSRRPLWLSCLIVVVSATLSLFCLLKIVGWL